MNDMTVAVADQGIAHDLHEAGAISAQALAEMREAAGRSQMDLDTYLLASKQVPRADLIQVAYRRKIPMTISRLSDLPEWTVVMNDCGQLIGPSAGRRDLSTAVITDYSDKGRRAFIVTADGAKKRQVADLTSYAISLGYRVAAVLVVSQDIVRLIYAEWDQRRAEMTGDAKITDSAMHEEFDAIAAEAVYRRASDIHLTCSRGRARVRFRVDGELEHYRDMSEDHARALAASVYNTLVETGSTMNSFNPSEKQDGAIERSLPSGQVRFRYSGLPIEPNGFDATFRVIVMGSKAARQTPEQLGYSKDQCHALRRMFSHPSGLILFAGTTGSGKSTSVANFLSQLAADRPGKLIRTVEEPVEYRIEGAHQTPVRRLKGEASDFLDVLRQILRSDPDYLMIGELRDGDTATLAIQAVRSGHLAVSTIHANGAPVIYDRLVGMGVSRMDMASVGLVVGLVYQGLVQLLCSNCKLSAASVYDSASEADKLVLDRARLHSKDLFGIYVKNPDGCDRCHQKGVHGRTVCAEIIRPSLPMLKAIAAGDSPQLWSQWRKTISATDRSDMTGRTAFEHAIWKMTEGLISPQAVETTFFPLDEETFEESAGER